MVARSARCALRWPCHMSACLGSPPFPRFLCVFLVKVSHNRDVFRVKIVGQK